MNGLRLLASLFTLVLAVAGPPIGASPAERLAEAVRFRTVSYQDRSRIDYSQFEGLLGFLRESYPRVFGELAVESMFAALAPRLGQPARLIFDNLWLTGGLVAGRMADDRLTQPFVRIATTDTRHYIDLAEHQYRFHGVLIESSQAASVHGTNEYIDIDSFEKSIAVAREMLQHASR